MLNIFKKQKNTKILDTSVIVDGRIVGVLETGFLEGGVATPSFVINELHALSDSKDAEKRKKGRRGLETLEKIRRLVDLEILDNFEDKVNEIKEVDQKLVALTKSIDGKLLTLDYGLNKIAKIHGAVVLNINDLFSAIRPLVLIGDIISVKIKKSGEQDGQGIGTLEDGTMVVVDGADKQIGKKVSIEVRQVLQNSSGRIVFAKLNLRGVNRGKL